MQDLYLLFLKGKNLEQLEKIYRRLRNGHIRLDGLRRVRAANRRHFGSYRDD